MGGSLAPTRQQHDYMDVFPAHKQYRGYMGGSLVPTRQPHDYMGGSPAPQLHMLNLLLKIITGNQNIVTGGGVFVLPGRARPRVVLDGSTGVLLVGTR